jgi:hypothetical protein
MKTQKRRLLREAIGREDLISFFPYSGIQLVWEMCGGINNENNKNYINNEKLSLKIFTKLLFHLTDFLISSIIMEAVCVNYD